MRGDAVVTRTGVFVYQNPDGTLRRELRHPDDVFARESMDSLKMIPITKDHPSVKLVSAENAKELSIGHTGENIYPNGQNLLAPLVITAKDGVEAVKNLGKKELSLGYTLDLEKEDGEYNGQRYDYRQRNIRYNHLAIVDRARAGGAARLNLDSGDALQVDADTTKPTEKEQITMLKVNIDGIQYDAAPEVAKALEKATARADKAEGDLKTAQTALDEQKTATAKAEAERDELKEKAENNDSAEKVQAAVKARLELERVAGKVLNEDAAAKIGDMTDADIKNAVIMAKNPNANLDGKSAEYVQARFDSVVEQLDNGSATTIQKAQMGERNDGTKVATDSAKAGEDAFADMKNQYKAKKESK